MAYINLVYRTATRLKFRVEGLNDKYTASTRQITWFFNGANLGTSDLENGFPVSSAKERTDLKPSTEYLVGCTISNIVGSDPVNLEAKFSTADLPNIQLITRTLDSITVQLQQVDPFYPNNSRRAYWYITTNSSTNPPSINSYKDSEALDGNYNQGAEITFTGLQSTTQYYIWCLVQGDGGENSSGWNEWYGPLNTWTTDSLHIALVSQQTNSLTFCVKGLNKNHKKIVWYCAGAKLGEMNLSGGTTESPTITKYGLEPSTQYLVECTIVDQNGKEINLTGYYFYTADGLTINSFKTTSEYKRVTITFECSGFSDGATYRISFGDGKYGDYNLKDSQQTIYYTYKDYGTYTITLEITSGGTTITHKETITISDGPFISNLQVKQTQTGKKEAEVTWDFANLTSDFATYKIYVNDNDEKASGTHNSMGKTTLYLDEYYFNQEYTITLKVYPNGNTDEDCLSLSTTLILRDKSSDNSVISLHYVTSGSNIHCLFVTVDGEFNYDDTAMTYSFNAYLDKDCTKSVQCSFAFDYETTEEDHLANLWFEQIDGYYIIRISNNNLNEGDNLIYFQNNTKIDGVEGFFDWDFSSISLTKCLPKSVIDDAITYALTKKKTDRSLTVSFDKTGFENYMDICYEVYCSGPDNVWKYICYGEKATFIPETAGYYNIIIYAYSRYTGQYVALLNKENNYGYFSDKSVCFYQIYTAQYLLGSTSVPWSWSTLDDGTDSSERQLAYKAITNKGLISDFSYTVWNDLVNKVYSITNKTLDNSASIGGWLTENANSNTTYLSYNDTKMSAEDRVLTADRFNAVKYNIGARVSTSLTDRVKGDIVKGNYFITLTNCLNAWIEGFTQGYKIYPISKKDQLGSPSIEEESGGYYYKYSIQGAMRISWRGAKTTVDLSNAVLKFDADNPHNAYIFIACVPEKWVLPHEIGLYAPADGEGKWYGYIKQANSTDVPTIRDSNGEPVVFCEPSSSENGEYKYSESDILRIEMSFNINSTPKEVIVTITKSDGTSVEARTPMTDTDGKPIDIGPDTACWFLFGTSLVPVDGSRDLRGRDTYLKNVHVKDSFLLLNTIDEVAWIPNKNQVYTNYGLVVKPQYTSYEIIGDNEEEISISYE